MDQRKNNGGLNGVNKSGRRVSQDVSEFTSASLERGVSYIAPLEERQREQNSEQSEIDRNKRLDDMIRNYPYPPPFTDEEKAKFLKRILPAKVAKDPGVPFLPYTEMYDPDALHAKCRKPLQGCRHLCQDPKIYNKPCSSCTFVVDYERACGHKTPIYCGMKKSLTECKEKCYKELKCSHWCTETCHFLRPCPPTCGYYTCPTVELELEVVPVPTMESLELVDSVPTAGVNSTAAYAPGVEGIAVIGGGGPGGPGISAGGRHGFGRGGQDQEVAPGGGGQDFRPRGRLAQVNTGSGSGDFGVGYATPGSGQGQGNRGGLGFGQRQGNRGGSGFGQGQGNRGGSGFGQGQGNRGGSGFGQGQGHGNRGGTGFGQGQGHGNRGGSGFGQSGQGQTHRGQSGYTQDQGQRRARYGERQGQREGPGHGQGGRGLTANSFAANFVASGSGNPLLVASSYTQDYSNRGRGSGFGGQGLSNTGEVHGPNAQNVPGFMARASEPGGFASVRAQEQPRSGLVAASFEYAVPAGRSAGFGARVPRDIAAPPGDGFLPLSNVGRGRGFAVNLPLDVDGGNVATLGRGRGRGRGLLRFRNTDSSADRQY